MVCYIFKQLPDEEKKTKLAKSLLNSWVRDKDKKNIYQKELVMQGAGHARQASHAIGASELEVKLWVGIWVEERVGASLAMGASELVVFSPVLVVGSSVMVRLRVFASQSDEGILSQEGAAQAGQELAKQGAHRDAGDPGGQVDANHGSHQDVRAFSGAVCVRGHARDVCGQGVGDCGREAVGYQGLEGGEHGGTVQGMYNFSPLPRCSTRSSARAACASCCRQLWLVLYSVASYQDSC